MLAFLGLSLCDRLRGVIRGCNWRGGFRRDGIRSDGYCTC